MPGMARRKLGTRGRLLAAGISVAVAATLAGMMAAGDGTANASRPATSAGTANSPGAFPGGAARSGDGSSFSDDGWGSDDGGSGSLPAPRAHTNTGGS